MAVLFKKSKRDIAFEFPDNVFVTGIKKLTTQRNTLTISSIATKREPINFEKNNIPATPTKYIRKYLGQWNEGTKRGIKKKENVIIVTAQ